MTIEKNRPTRVLDAALEDIRQQLQTIQFGSLEITIHNGQIVQIERREKKRYEPGDSARN